MTSDGPCLSDSRGTLFPQKTYLPLPEPSRAPPCRHRRLVAENEAKPCHKNSTTLKTTLPIRVSSTTRTPLPRATDTQRIVRRVDTSRSVDDRPALMPIHMKSRPGDDNRVLAILNTTHARGPLVDGSQALATQNLMRIKNPRVGVNQAPITPRKIHTTNLAAEESLLARREDTRRETKSGTDALTGTRCLPRAEETMDTVIRTVRPARQWTDEKGVVGHHETTATTTRTSVLVAAHDPLHPLGRGIETPTNHGREIEAIALLATMTAMGLPYHTDLAHKGELHMDPLHLERGPHR
ncbi:uncharacterized protein J7T54_000183 [Emericellopsis cladophorae]|uniref:Uncharacterized protein n=1 Tax=Emericellopsis cladophorae TaxID=2686198 RepID=A0A9P9XZU7_9HYPO|nr:uncharacterized protein J7T54_000183 [Emericellopsis cladophorae]KAI6780543.1 hypothetical protein J7T54_000183 [Emericellopsis cladophorae]